RPTREGAGGDEPHVALRDPEGVSDVAGAVAVHVAAVGVSKLRACPEPHVVLRHDQGVSDAHAPVAVHVPAGGASCTLLNRARDLLDTIVAVGDEDVPAPSHGDASGVGELPVPAALAAALRNEGPGVRELLDAVVGEVGDEDVPAPIHGDTSGEAELPVLAALAAPLRDEGPGERLRLAPAVAGVAAGGVTAHLPGEAVGLGARPPAA